MKRKTTRDSNKRVFDWSSSQIISGIVVKGVYHYFQ